MNSILIGFLQTFGPIPYLIRRRSESSSEISVYTFISSSCNPLKSCVGVMMNRGRIEYYHISWHLASQDTSVAGHLNDFVLVSTVLKYVRKIFLFIYTATVGTRKDVAIL